LAPLKVLGVNPNPKKNPVLCRPENFEKKGGTSQNFPTIPGELRAKGDKIGGERGLRGKKCKGPN